MVIRKFLVAVLAVVFTVGATAVGYAAISGVTEPAKPRDHAPGSPRPGSPAGQDEGPQTVTPRPGMSNVRPISWQQANPQDDQTVRVLFDSGVEPCHVLDHVTVGYGTDEVIITLYEGSDPAAEGQACIQIAVEKATVVTLDEPLQGRTIVDGSSPVE